MWSWGDWAGSGLAGGEVVGPAHCGLQAGAAGIMGSLSAAAPKPLAMRPPVLSAASARSSASVVPRALPELPSPPADLAFAAPALDSTAGAWDAMPALGDPPADSTSPPAGLLRASCTLTELLCPCKG